MTTTLNGGGGPVPLDTPGYTLQAPGLRGKVTEHSPQTGTRSSAATARNEALREALSGAGVAMPKEFEIELTEDMLPPLTAGTRADGLTAVTREGDPAIVFSMPDLGPDRAAAVLYQDEYGLAHWVFPQAGSQAGAATRGGGGALTFNLPRPRRLPLANPPAPESGTRGLFAQLGRPIIRVLAWSLKDVVGGGVLAAAEAWERHARPYGFHQIAPDKYAQKKPEGAPVDWSLFNGGRALLLFHGLFSSSEGTFGLFAKDTLQALSAQYGGRLLAFNHPTVHVSPVENIQTFFQMIPSGVKFEVDILGHSRGGLMTRELLRQLAAQPEADRPLTPRRAVTVGTPHAGTPLTNPEYAVEMLDRYTNLLVDLPDGVFTVTMEALLITAKLLAYGAMEKLPGLKTISPDNDYLKSLNASAFPPVELFTMAADYTPADPGLVARLAKTALDAVIDNYMQASNDRLVPVFSAHHPSPDDGHHRKTYERTDNVHHNNFFSQPGPQQQLIDWLKP